MMRVFADMAAHQIAHDVKAQRVETDRQTQIDRIIMQQLFKPVFQPILRSGDRSAGWL